MKAVVLAGGKSSRMGENKALLQLQGETFISKIGKTLSTVFPDKILPIMRSPTLKFLIFIPKKVLWEVFIRRWRSCVMIF